MTDKKKGLEGIAPPPRKASGNLAQATGGGGGGDKVQFNVRISAASVTYAKVLALKMRRPLHEVVEEALTLLEEKHGSV